MLFILILNNFPVHVRKYIHITVFVIWCRFHFCQHFELLLQLTASP